jgi:RNA polymerase sigma factor (sigma-70 family)
VQGNGRAKCHRAWFEEHAMPENRISDPETWVDQFGDYLYNYALSRIQNPSTAEDMVQETFLAALRDQGNFKGLSSERTWLTSILKHKIIDHIRKMSREHPVDDLDSATDFSEKLVDRKEFWEILNHCLSDLSERLALAFRLREIDGMNCDEICNVLQITPSNCWVMLYRARMSIRRCLEIKWFDGKAGEGS